MATPLWDSKRISSEVIKDAINYVPTEAAVADMVKMAAEYEAERSKLLDQNANLTTQNSTLQGDLAAALAQLASYADVTVAISTTSVLNRTAVGVSWVENPPVWTNTTAWPTVKVNVQKCTSVHKIHIYPFGLVNPWGDKTKPIDTTSLTNAIKKIREVDANAPIILTLYGAEYWMKGKYNSADGSTVLMTSSETYSDQGRVMVNFLPQWLQLVDAVVRVAAAYGCADVEIWNEAKGMYSRPDGLGQAWDGRYAAGNPNSADMGYSYFAEASAKQVITTMTALAKIRSSYRIGAPYPPMTTRGDLTVDAVPNTHPLYKFKDFWGYMDKAPVNFVREFLGNARDHNISFDVLTLDISTGIRSNSGTYPTNNPFDLSRKIGDVTAYMRTVLTEFGFNSDMPVDYTELYVAPQPEMQTADSQQIRAAMWGDVLKNAVMNRVRYLIPWGPMNRAGGNFPTEGAMVSSDGTLQAVGNVLIDFKTNFAPGTKVYPLQPSNNLVDGFASDSKIFAYNKTDSVIKVAVPGKIVTMDPYEVAVFSR